MKRIILALTVAVLFTAVSAFAQDNQQEKKDIPAYTIIGAGISLDYFLIEDSTSNPYMVFKTPVAKNHGIEFDFGTMTVPITSYSLGAASYSGFGQEKYVNASVNYIFFFPFHRYFQLKAGVDYYHFLSGFIADSPTGANCGTLYNECSNCTDNLFGATLGVNLDVPLFDDFYAMTSLGYKYLFIHEEHLMGVVDLRIGLGYKL